MQTLKIRHLMIVFALTTLISSGSFAGSGNGSSESPEGLINLLYKTYAWEAIGDLDGVSLENRESQELRNYFTAALAAQIRNDHECAVRTEDICHLDFNIIFDSQDPLVFDLKISPMNRQNEIMVSYKNRPDGEKKIKFKMVKTDQGWRIDDILYTESPYSLRAILESSAKK